MLASLVVDPVLIKLVILAVSIIVLGSLLKWLKQPYIIAYIIAGVLLGPFGLEIIIDEALISNFGSFGLILLLFFIGMEISLPQLITNWKISVLGTLVQVLLSVSVVWIIGLYLDWNMPRIILLGFVMSLSSTAVVIKLLQERNETSTKIGQTVIGILIAQDIIIVPMLILLNYLSGNPVESGEVIRQVIGGVLIVGMIILVLRKKNLRLPFGNRIAGDHEIQLFVALTICFGFSIITAFFGISSALGAFVAGIIVSSAKATKWVHESLQSLRILFVAIFFVSIGMLVDLTFLWQHFSTVMIFVVVVFVVNNLINATIMKIFKFSWKDSLYAGAILAQIGEFSFILGSTGFAIGMISDYGYQLTIAIISISLIISPIWVMIVSRIAYGKK